MGYIEKYCPSTVQQLNWDTDQKKVTRNTYFQNKNKLFGIRYKVPYQNKKNNCVELVGGSTAEHI
jgi:hypothetical protein